MYRFEVCNVFLATAASLGIAAQVHAFPDALSTHVGINVVDGQLTTQGWLSGTGYLGEQRVFTNAFDSATFFTGSPGTNSLGGTFATPGAIGFNILDALRLWDEVNETFHVAAETLTVGLGPVSATTSDGFVAGFATNIRDESSHPNNPEQWGRHHVHFDFGLNGAGGLNPQDGIFLLQLRWWYQPGDGNTTTYDDSKPFWIVFGLNRSDEEILAAAQWVQINMVPAPGALALIALAAMGTSTRRRRLNGLSQLTQRRRMRRDGSSPLRALRLCVR